MRRYGIDTVKGILAHGMESWRDQGLPIESIVTTSASNHTTERNAGR
jgi:3-mercaptopyruvate sulfurtransferase SseA